MTVRPLAALLCALALPACAAASTPSAMPLRDGWKLRVAGQPARTVSVPSVFDARARQSEFNGTTAVYQVQFRTPQTPHGFGWGVRFEQARRTAVVSLNGRRIGSHSDPYTGFALALPQLRDGAMNTLTVRVDNRRYNAEPREGWWNWGGLSRPVTLIPLGPVVASDLALLPRLSCAQPERCTGYVLLDTTLRNRSQVATRPHLALTLASPNGGPTQHASVTAPPLAAGSSEHFQARIPLRAPVQTWSPDAPRLYSASVATYAGGALAQQTSLQVGMRQVSVQSGLLMLNGRQIDLRGASVEEDIQGHGAALTAADDARIVGDLQALHANVTRAQYPLGEDLLSRLDRAGILVWSQAPIYHRDLLLRTAAQRRLALTSLRDTVLQTRAHASIATESVANELSPTPDSVPGTRAYLHDAASLVRTLDPGTPVSVDLFTYPGFAVQRAYAQFDLLGINNYYGWYTGRRGHSTASLSGLAPFLEQTHQRYPAQALVMSEFGAEANVNGPATVKQTYSFQSQYLQRTLEAVASLPFMNGAIYWTLREFAVKPHWDGGAHRHDIPHTVIHHKGLIAYDGTRKPAFAVAARLFGQTPLYRTPGAPAGSPPPGGGGGPPFGWTVLTLLAGSALVLLSRSLRRSLRPRGGEVARAGL
ncbi:MAG: glycoside hydrolase family 2 TIM barrel-domain containing protein [Solirubrobacteraceae bacterium]